MQPEVSVCIPAYRAEAFLGDAIESVLAQTFTNWELVILDNASDDGTADVYNRYSDTRIRILRNAKTLDMAPNWNRAAAAATAPLMKLLPDDDLLSPRCLETKVAIMNEHPDVALVACRRTYVDDNGEVLLENRGLRNITGKRTGTKVIREIMRSGINPIGDPAAVMFRREHFLQVEGFDQSVRMVMDLDLNTRLLQFGNFYGIDETLASFRIQGNSVTASKVGATAEQHRTLLDRLANDPAWSTRRSDLFRGKILTYGADAERRYRYRKAAAAAAEPGRDPKPVVSNQGSQPNPSPSLSKP